MTFYTYYRGNLLCFALVAGTLTSPLTAGELVSLADCSKVTGTLSLNPESVHVDAVPASDIKLTDVLEASFADAPFYLQYFSSTADESDQLPQGWQIAAGTAAYSSGTFSIAGAKRDSSQSKDGMEPYFFVGRPWNGDGRWTARLKGTEPAELYLKGGLMIRDTLDPASPLIGIGSWDANLAFDFGRNSNRSTWQNMIEVDNFKNKIPFWVRMTRRGYSLEFEKSNDGSKWTAVSQNTMHLARNVWAGLFLRSEGDNIATKVLVDQVLFTPAPADTLSTGVLLRSGSFLAGHFDQLNFDEPSSVGKFIRNGVELAIPSSQVASVIYHPVTRAKIQAADSQTGILMRNGDFLAGSFDAIDGERVNFSSLLLGSDSYDLDEMSACVINPLKPRPTQYELRLKDGSCICTNSLSSANGKLVINDASGVKISVALEEIAQFRAGPPRAQTLVDLDWTAKMDSANLGATASSVVDRWTGSNQEEILALRAGTTVDFPLVGKFRALVLRVALLPDSTPNLQATLRILADGKEIARTPAIKSGYEPQFLMSKLDVPKIITLVADSNSPSARVILIDPVVVQDNQN